MGGLIAPGSDVPRARGLATVGLIAGAAALVAWLWDLRRLNDANDRARAELEGRDQRLYELTGTLQAERDRAAKLERSWREEREWHRRLRVELLEAHQHRGALSDPKDVPSMVLRLALELLRAEKGLLLSREDADHDGLLDLIAHDGFDNDPTESVTAQRFASEVIAGDRTVREDNVRFPDHASGADREIENLVAIPIYLRDRFSGVIVAANKLGGFHEHDEDVLLALGDHAGSVLANTQLRRDLRDSYVSTVRILADSIEAKDPFLRGHSEEVSQYVAAVAEHFDLDPRQRELLVFASLLHDLGKIGISERILLKPDKLTAEEFNVIKLHPRIGYRLIDQVPTLRSLGPAVLHHHERFDGTGYPLGLKGLEIPLEARIIGIADAFSAMTSQRPYRARVSLEEACAELERCAGTQFDPEIAAIFVDAVRRIGPGDASAVAAALSDQEIVTKRHEDEPVLGWGSYAITDNLTLLYSLRYFHEMAQAEAQRAEVQGSGFVVTLFEVTEIEQVNREEGYLAGDRLIQQAARALHRAAVEAGGTACRYGGPRLALLCTGRSVEQVQEMAEKVDAEAGGTLRWSVAAWGPGDSGHDVVDRARSGLSKA